MVECDRHKVEVAGSNPARPTTFPPRVRPRNRGFDAISESPFASVQSSVQSGWSLRGTGWHSLAHVAPAAGRECGGGAASAPRGTRAPWANRGRHVRHVRVRLPVPHRDRPRQLRVGGGRVARAHPDVRVPEDRLARLDALGQGDAGRSGMAQPVRRTTPHGGFVARALGSPAVRCAGSGRSTSQNAASRFRIRRDPGLPIARRWRSVWIR